MIGRATRYDQEAGPWEDQLAHVFVPDDPDMNAIITNIKAEELEAVRAMKPEQHPPGVDEAEEPPGKQASLPSIIPEASAVTRQRVSDMSSDEQAGFQETAAIKEAMSRQGIYGPTALQMKRFLLDMGAGQLSGDDLGATAEAEVLPPSEREGRLRQNIQRFCANNDRRRELEWGVTNREVFEHFGKSREDMTLSELSAVWAWLQDKFGEAP
jgi:hypothetical protein